VCEITDINDLRRIHHRYGLALDTEDKAKTILVGDKLKFASEQLNTVKTQIRLPMLDFSFKYYEDVRNDIGKLDDDIIGLLQDYVKDVTELAEKIANEMTAMRASMGARGNPNLKKDPDDEVDLGEDGQPHFINNPEPEPPAKVREEIPSASIMAPKSPEIKYGIEQYDADTRVKMVRKAYTALPEKKRTAGKVVKYFLQKWGVTVSKQTIINYLRKENLPLRGTRPNIGPGRADLELNADDLKDPPEDKGQAQQAQEPSVQATQDN